jgi:hypothetical protein
MHVEGHLDVLMHRMLSWPYPCVVFSEVQEMEQNLPKSCRVHFDDPNKLHKFNLTIAPEEGYWANGKFKFYIDVPEDYNIAVSIILSQSSTLANLYFN